MIIDCFLFYNELDLLEIRLQELQSIVDWFVLVEAGETFCGKSKEYVFAADREAFAAYNLCYVRIATVPSALTSAWIFGNQEHEGECHKCGFTPQILAQQLVQVHKIELTADK